MKKGSEVHRALEEQVHITVPIETATKEDRFGLKLWNTIQRLRTLRETGLTRELEVWGVVDGQVINGVIDELSYTCPDPDYEESLEKSKVQKSGGTLPVGQLSIAQSFANASSQGDSWLGALVPDKKVYLADVKTRGVRTVPAGASLRPTWMQLMLYRKLLESLALNNVDAEIIFARYDLQPRDSFTETFIEGISGVGGGLDMMYEDEKPFAALQDSEINAHNNLILLWSLMISEFSCTITSLSDVLRAEFRYSKTGEMIGSEVFAYSANVIEDYTSKQLDWWKGQREAKGVEIEEAFKCRICDFAENCTWRNTKIEEATEKHRLRAARRAKSVV
jgi:exonuclease V